ncbi:MAG: SH3 domain-containing protein [Clostridia bacterium]|nr:SH3 domain-containing protein [Clostridia bacterium]
MVKKRICSAIAAVILIAGIGTNAAAAGITYLPDVTKNMSDASYWTDENKVLMTYDEIQSLNTLTISGADTYMYDLKNQPETVDGVSLNEALLKSSRADAGYYLGWTYIESEALAAEQDFEEFIKNTQNQNPSKEQKVLYGIAVRRTELRTFPSHKAIWDDPKDADFDYQYLSSIRINEPLVITSVSADGKYYLAKNICCSGWVPAETVAICKDKAEWLSAWDIAPEKALVVYGDKVYTENSVSAAITSDLMLTMGTVLEQAEPKDVNMLVDNRALYQNYVVWMPVRNDDGTYAKKMTLISEHNKVSDGYLPLTKENIAMVAFSALGNTYGWGGSLLSDDCSGYIRNIYKCFGLELARNTTWQTAMPMAKTHMQYMCREEREIILDALPFGSVLYFNGHEMMYLGKENGKYYVISSISTIMCPEDSSVRQRIRSIVVNTLEIKRANGNTWLDDLTVALVPYWTAENSGLPEYEWYHDGVAFCLKNNLMQGDENRYFNPDENITWAELLQILRNMEGKLGEENTAEATDNGGNWYDAAVQWAADTKLVYENDADFAADSPMTREQLASVLYLYAQFKELDTEKNADISTYADAEQISDYLITAMQYAVGSGLMKGDSEGLLNPMGNTTRAEAAVILERFAKLS